MRGAQRKSRQQLFETNVVPLGSALLNYFTRRTSIRADAADLVSEVFVIAWRRIDDVPADTIAAKRWLYSVARGVLANYRRGELRRHELSAGLKALLREEVPPVHTRGAELLSGLRPADRELLMLVYWDGLPLTEAAGVLGIRASAARKRAERAKARLQQRLENVDPGGARDREGGERSLPSAIRPGETIDSPKKGKILTRH